MKSNFFSKVQKVVIFGTMVVIFFLIFSTYAINFQNYGQSLLSEIIRIDEEAYGNTVFDSSELDFSPILDSEVRNGSNHVIHIEFVVGGSKLNNKEGIIYDIALNDLEVDCALLSPYLKWSLYKNNELLSNGSLDYQFDTIQDGRMVLTNIQEDLKDYREDKSSYDSYDFYMWISDSCQSEDLFLCKEAESQSDLLNRQIKGRIEVELYADYKKALVRTPSQELDKSTCQEKGGVEDVED